MSKYMMTLSSVIAFGLGGIILVILKLLKAGYGEIISWSTIIAVVVIGIVITAIILFVEKSR